MGVASVSHTISSGSIDTIKNILAAFKVSKGQISDALGGAKPGMGKNYLNLLNIQL